LLNKKGVLLSEKDDVVNLMNEIESEQKGVDVQLKDILGRDKENIIKLLKNMIGKILLIRLRI